MCVISIKPFQCWISLWRSPDGQKKCASWYWDFLIFFNLFSSISMVACECLSDWQSNCVSFQSVSMWEKFIETNPSPNWWFGIRESPSKCPKHFRFRNYISLHTKNPVLVDVICISCSFAACNPSKKTWGWNFSRYPWHIVGKPLPPAQRHVLYGTAYAQRVIWEHQNPSESWQKAETIDVTWCK